MRPARNNTAGSQQQASPPPRGRSVRPRQRTVPALQLLPDQFALQAASLGAMTNTFSPASRGPRDTFRGDPGYGMNGNRMGGRTVFSQAYVGASVYPVAKPKSTRVGAQGGPSSEPGFPSTGGVGSTMFSHPAQWVGSQPGSVSRLGMKG